MARSFGFSVSVGGGFSEGGGGLSAPKNEKALVLDKGSSIILSGIWEGIKGFKGSPLKNLNVI
jgi:hypothetical protein